MENLREHFAGIALQAFLSNPYLLKALHEKATKEDLSLDEELAINIVETVDALINELNKPKKEDEKYVRPAYTMPIETFILMMDTKSSLQCRIRSACNVHDIENVGQLIRLGKFKFLKSKLVGKKSVRAIENQLQKYGLLEEWLH